MAAELKTLRDYTKAVGKYWWAIVPGLVLTLMDGIERLFGAWYLPPLWAKVTTGIAGLVLAQYLAYRDLAHTTLDTTAAFKERLRAVFRSAELRWSLNQPRLGWDTETLCKQVNEFRVALSAVYAESPPSWDSEALRGVIERLKAMEEFHVDFGGRESASRKELTRAQRNADEIREQMKTALADVRTMLT